MNKWVNKYKSNKWVNQQCKKLDKENAYVEIFAGRVEVNIPQCLMEFVVSLWVFQGPKQSH